MTEPQAEPTRCWPDVDVDPRMIAYHDEEWGTPLHDDNKLFEFLILEGFQAGLSWRTILNKREAFRKAFADFDVQKVAQFGDDDVARLLEDKGIVRNRLKILGAINNAQRFMEIQDEFGSFDRYIWQFTDYKTLRSPKPILGWEDVPATSPESDAMAKDLKVRGFKFVGSTVCYAHMQATGMVNDHQDACFKATLGDW
ncbi:MAG: DNA-3-methyladenine glycosylase I [Dehalococcoidia bacterium]|nr:DNA-3-methyladenine glycosylase I [Dehalococcoidia bacterium]